MLADEEVAYLRALFEKAAPNWPDTSGKDDAFIDVRLMVMNWLSRIESSRAIIARNEAYLERLNVLLLKAIGVFGSVEKACHWLMKQSVALGTRPLNKIWTDLGAAEVLAELGRIDYGVSVEVGE